MSRYLITFDMDTDCLKQHYHGNNATNAYADIKRILERYGFHNIQGSVYLGDEGVSESHGTLALQELTIKYDWFYSCISNVKFYRLEGDVNAQFIVDGTHKAKQAFNQKLALLKKSLIESGLNEQQIKKILDQQTFEPNQLENNYQDF